MCNGIIKQILSYFIKKINRKHFYQFYLNRAGSNHSYDIGNDTDWNIVDKIIRKYRNYVHLQEYEKRINKIGPLREKDFEQLNKSLKNIVSQ